MEEKTEAAEAKPPPLRRPPNAFLLYCLDKRSSLKRSDQSQTNSQITKQLTQMWANETEECKKKYKEKASALFSEFKSLHPEYSYRRQSKKPKASAEQTSGESLKSLNQNFASNHFFLQQLIAQSQK